MTKEQSQPQTEGFRLSENERLFDKVSDKRFQHLIFDAQTTIHEFKLDSNSYGEFLFVTVSRAKGQGREILTFWGLGYHEYRERWFTEEWSFHESYPSTKSLGQQLSHKEAKRLIQERKSEVEHEAQEQSPQSAMGALFEILADITDEDGALSELEDLGSLVFLLDDESNSEI
jgi:hypothetical protein